MKVLFCHNYYRIRGGEDVSFEADVQMLRDYGHQVVTLTRDNADIKNASMLQTTRDLFWNAAAEKEAEQLIADFQPDVLHCNNLFPQISPSVYRAANRAKVPVVQAIRNYRYFCSGGTFFRDGKVCTDCVGKSFAYPSILNACYRDSRIGSTLVSAMHSYHRASATWQKRVTRFFTPSQFAKDTCVTSGLAASQVDVKTNFVYPALEVGKGDGNFALFVGRLTQDKGTQTMLEVWTRMNPALPLKIIGEGDLSALHDTTGNPANVEMLGKQPMDVVLDYLGRATCLVFPSQWYETFGRSIAEAYSRGTPVIASDLGVMKDHIDHGETGLLFQPGDAVELAKSLQFLVDNPEATKRMRINARERFLERFTRQQSYDQLMSIYRAAGVSTKSPASDKGLVQGKR